MSFPPAFLDELRARLTLSSLAGKGLRLQRAGREYKACCPFHKEKTPSFYINDEKQFYHCFGCGAHGDVIGFTMRYQNLSFPEVIENLAAQAGLEVPQDTPVERERFDREKSLHNLLERATVFFEEQLRTPAGREAYGYLLRRGLDEEGMRRFRLGYAPQDAQALIQKLTAEGFSLSDMMDVGLIKKSENREGHFSFFRHRVMFPVGDARGRIVAFGGRVLDDGEPKYLNSPDHVLFHKGTLLYGLSRARAALAQGQPIIVVEGYMDVIALVEAGYQGAVAPLGTALTEDQMKRIWQLLPQPENRDPSRDYSPILCFDGDGAGVRAAARAVERALPLLTPQSTIRVAYLPEGDDPDDLIKESGKAAMDEVLARAQPMIDVLWNMTLQGRQTRTPEERAAFRTALSRRTARIADEGLRRLYHDEMQKRFAEAFQRRPDQAFQKGKFVKGRFTAPLLPTLPPKAPPDGSLLKEKIFLALMVNHPDLFGEFGEDFSRLTFSKAPLEALRQEIVTILSSDSHEPLDADELSRHLSVGGGAKAWKTGLAEVLSETTYTHAQFARPGKPLATARQGWKSIWNKEVQEQLATELQAAEALWVKDGSDANWLRLEKLRNDLKNLKDESALEEMQEPQA